MNEPTPDEVLAANISYHSALAENYDREQPHFRPENLARVDSILRELAERTGGGSLIDLGCGTGFVINLAKAHFDRVVGVDITPAMLNRVDLSQGNVEVCLCTTDATPFGDGEFDACTAYGYLHHLYDLGLTFREAARLVRPGGRFFSDQDPNRAFWAHLTLLSAREDLSGFVAREAEAVTRADEVVADETQLTPAQVRLAEFQKMETGGLDADDMVGQLRAAGFSQADSRLEWYLGQGSVLHEQGEDASRAVELYLRSALPASSHLFKYISLSATR